MKDIKAPLEPIEDAQEGAVPAPQDASAQDTSPQDISAKAPVSEDKPATEDEKGEAASAADAASDISSSAAPGEAVEAAPKSPSDGKGE